MPQYVIFYDREIYKWVCNIEIQGNIQSSSFGDDPAEAFNNAMNSVN